MKLTKTLLEQMIREAMDDDPQQWLSPDVKEDDIDLDKDDWNKGDPEPLRDWFNDILSRRVQMALRDAAKDIAEEVDFDKEYKRDLFDAIGIDIEEDLLDFLRPVAGLLAAHNQRYPDPLSSSDGVALRTKLAENKDEDLEAERVEMEDKIARRLKARKKGNVEDLMGSSFENSIARIKARIEKEEDPSKKRDLEKMLAAQERNLAMMTENKFNDRLRGAGKIHDLLVGALEEQEVFPMGQIPEQILKAIFNLSLRIWDESVVEENVEKNHAQVSEAQFQMARADMESKMLENAAKNILNVLLLKHKLSKEDQYEYKEDIKSGIENIIKMLRKEMV
ncbi:MAG: hypothetical protein GY751_18475 [Bacteroidetes bacterium]|nr:hypothetical protein [Bacteroidota bacterium]